MVKRIDVPLGIQTRVDFLPRKYDVISQLRHSYAKDPFCVPRLIWLLKQTIKIRRKCN